MPEATDGLITTNAGTDCSVCEGENDEGTPGSEPPTVPGAQPGHQGALWGPSLIGGEALYYVSTPPERLSAGLQCLLDSVETLS